MGLKRAVHSVPVAMMMLLVMIVLVSAQAGPKTLSLRVASGGGGVVNAGGYTLVGAIGQHDAGVRSSGTHLLAGGVLAFGGGGDQPTPTPPPPTSRTWLPLINNQ
jgi:hypothetical protein